MHLGSRPDWQMQVPRSVLAQSISGGAEGKQFYLDSVSVYHRASPMKEPLLTIDGAFRQQHYYKGGSCTLRSSERYR